MITNENIQSYKKALNPTRDIYTIIANLCNNPKLIINPEYKLTEDDFPEVFHKIVFSSINNLVVNSIDLDEVTAVDIDNYLSNKPELYKIWKDSDGIKYIMDTKELSNDGLFEYSYHKIKKYSLLRELLDNGFDISEIYPIDDLNIMTESAKKLDDMTDADIMEYYTNKIIDVRNNWNIDSGTMEDFIAGDDLEGLFEELKEEPDLGYPFPNGYYNTLFRGMRESKYMLRSGRSGFGKAVDNETVIPTTDGFKKVGEVKNGDYLYDRLGRPTKVIGVYPHKNKKAYKVTLSDGRSFIACDEHLIPYYSIGRHKNILNKPLGEMIKDYKKIKKNKNGSIVHHKYNIPNNESVDFPYSEIPLGAYGVGALLGDGYLSGERIQFSTDEEDVLNNMMKSIGFDKYKKISEKNYGYDFPQYLNKNYKEIKKSIENLSINVGSGGKFIPDIYKYNSIDVRKEVIKGLLDTDGTIVGGKDRDSYSYSITTISSRMKNDILEICRSLGYGTSVFKEKRCDKYSTGECFMIGIFTPDIIVSSEKHLNKIKNRKYKSNKHKYNQIVDIVEVDPRDMTCFTVDNEESLFLINDYIVTHNTRLAVRDLLDIACSEIYRNAEWQSLGPSIPAMLISTELKKRELQLMMLAYISGIDQNVISDGSYDDGTRDRLMKAMNIINKAPFYISVIEDFSASDIEMKIEEYIIGSGVKFVSFDYIQVTPKLVSSSKKQYGTDRREDLILVELSASLKRIANKHDVYIISGTQLNDNWEFREKRNEACLRGSKAIADKVDHGILTFGVDEHDLKKLKPILEQNTGFANKKPNYSHWVYKNRSGAKDVVIWSRMDLGTIREEVLFVTDYQYNLIDMEERVIEIVEDDTVVF